VNIANIQNIVVELFNENILRGRGMLARALIKAQMASPNFTHVYAALIAVINTKVPEIGLLVAKRVLIQYRRSF
jgi:pre-mRNA-splicing factor CWC22